jgi:hypothetical protein
MKVDLGQCSHKRGLDYRAFFLAEAD